MIIWLYIVENIKSVEKSMKKVYVLFKTQISSIERNAL